MEQRAGLLVGCSTGCCLGRAPRHLWLGESPDLSLSLRMDDPRWVYAAKNPSRYVHFQGHTSQGGHVIKWYYEIGIRNCAASIQWFAPVNNSCPPQSTHALITSLEHHVMHGVKQWVIGTAWVLSAVASGPIPTKGIARWWPSRCAQGGGALTGRPTARCV